MVPTKEQRMTHDEKLMAIRAGETMTFPEIERRLAAAKQSNNAFNIEFWTLAVETAEVVAYLGLKGGA